MTDLEMTDLEMTNLEAALRAYPATAAAAGRGPGRPPVLEGDVSYVLEDYPVGRMLLAARREGGVLLASVYIGQARAEEKVLDCLARAASPRVVRSAAGLDPVRRELEEFFAGRRHTFDVPTDLCLASSFQQQVLQALSGVPYGRTTTYGALAASIDRPGAARAVGAALGGNPLCVVLPCHRVLASGGALSGYAGGPAAKQHLLALERRG